MINKDWLRKLKLIVFDVDGTLINNMGEIGDETLELVSALKNHDINFSLASGRQHSSLRRFSDKLELQIPIISLDGALIKSPVNGSVFYESFIPKRYVKKAVEFADKFLLKAALCHDEAIYYSEHDDVIPQLLEKFEANYQKVKSLNNYVDQTLEMVITGDYRDSIKYVSTKLDFPYTFGLSTNYYKSHSHPGIYYLEVRKQGTNKKKGLTRLCKKLGISEKETAILGDWYNDIQLFESKAMKIALANAVPEIVRRADFVTKRDNNEDGTAEFLRMVLDAKERK
jgi:hypothetical protein